MKRFHRILTIYLLCMVLCLSVLPSFAAEITIGSDQTATNTETTQTPEMTVTTETPTTDTYTSVRVDNFTGEKIADDSSNDLTRLSAGCSYDKAKDVFIFQTGFSDGATFNATVPDGAIVQNSVSLAVKDSLSPKLYRGGALVENVDLSSITQSGAYALTVVDQDTEVKVLTFTILGEYVGALYELEVPSGFRVVGASCADQAMAYSDDVVPLQQEGKYIIIYGCDAIDKRYQVEFTVDHTPPELTFDGVTDGVARGPVTIFGVQEGDTVSIFYNRTQAAYSTTLSAAGDYAITVTDAAGNSTDYAFTIRTYFNSLTWVLVGLIAALLLLSMGYVVYKRKKFRSN